MTRLLNSFLILISIAGFSHSAFAFPITYTATLNGLNEAPPNASQGSGSVWGELDDIAHTLSVNVTFSGLTGNVTAAHIHAATAVPGVGTAGVATVTPTFTGFPSGVTSGSYNHIFNTALASSWNLSFITANGGTPASAEAALNKAIKEGKAYLNIHTTSVPGGEIRGFLAVPEPTSISLMSLGVLGFMFAKRSAA